MTIVAKNGLILIALMDKDFYRDLMRQFGENILDIFYSMYKNKIDNYNSQPGQFKEFRQVLFYEIQSTLDKLKDINEKRNFLKEGLEYNE
jgi:hypothetical protein